MKAKRLLALLLALVMALTLLPTAAGATEQTEEETPPVVTVTRETDENRFLTDDTETEAALPTPPTGNDLVDFEQEAVKIKIGGDLDPALPNLSDDVLGEIEVVSLREPDEAPVPSAPPRRRAVLRGTEIAFGGSGTEEDPWQITSADELLTLANIVNAGNACSGQYFSLTQDVGLAGVNWTPIGCAWDITFAGVFLGNDHIVSGLSIESDGDYIGLFGCVTGTVKDLNLSSANISGRNYVGGIAGCNYGVIDDCDFTGTVSGGDYVGGIAGCSGKDATVKDCDVSAAVNGVGTGIGGVVGWLNNIAGASDRADALNDPDSNATGGALVKYCTYTGVLTGRSPYGVGVASSSNGTITITVTANAFGGIVGWNNGGTVSDCENYGTVNGDDFAGGVVGDSSNGGRVEWCRNYGEVHGASMLNGGIAGRVAEGSIYVCMNDGEVSGGDFTGGVVGAIDKYSSISNCANNYDGSVTSEIGKFVGGVVGIANCAVTTCYNDGSVTGAYGVGGVVGWTIREIRDCHNGDPGSVTGTGEDGRVGGVVGNAYGLVENCFNDGSVTGTVQTGGVVGNLNATVRSCHNNGTVQGTDGVGGVVGSASESSVVSDCYHGGSVTGNQLVGGVAGIAFCLVSNCKNTSDGLVTGTGAQTGGVVGYMNEKGRPQSLQNEGTVTGTQYVGGLIGLAQCALGGLANDGTVTGEQYVGGVAGYSTGCTGCTNNGTVNVGADGSTGGGIVGASGGEIASCVNNGAVKGGQSVGGVIGGAQRTVKDCTNAGSVTAENGKNVGGIAGFCNPGAAVSDSKNSGVVSGNMYVGGIVGYMGKDSGVSDCQNTESGAVTCTGSNCGGIAGVTFSSVTNCTNAGTVSGTTATGGIVGYALDNGAIEHCTNLAGSTVSASSPVTGGIAGISASSITACVNEGKITGQNETGGIVGNIFSDGVVRGCRNNGEITGTIYVGGIAGLVGETDDAADPSGLVEDCVNASAVSGGVGTGGIAGAVHGTVKDCENTAALTGTASATGGVAGYVQDGGTVSGCSNRGAITAGGEQTGGVVGTNTGAIENCFNYAVINGGSFDTIGGIAGGSGATGTITACTNKAKVSSSGGDTGGVAGTNNGAITGCSNAAELTNTGGYIGGIAGENTGAVMDCTNTGKITSKTGSRAYAGGVVGYSSGSVTSCNNSAQINAGEGVGGIAGYFYGSGSIDGCFNNGTVTAPSGAAGGIVGAINSNSKVLNCTNTAAVNGSGQDSVGGVIGIAQSNNTVTNCTNTGFVTGNNSVGGILGENGSSGTYSKLTNSGAVTGNYETGGIAGEATAVFTDCWNLGTVTGTSNGSTTNAHGTGGVIGRLTGSSSKAERCKNEGTVSGTYFVGGIVGVDDSGTLSDSLNQGAVDSRNTSAGKAWVGGVVGYVQNATVSECVNYASIGSGTNINYVGGIAGSAAKVLFDFCRNYATITGRQEIGGIVGYTTHINNSGTTVQRCINSGHVTASGAGVGDVGGIVGKADWYTTVNECANNNPNAKVQATTGDYGGGIVGLMSNGTISNCYNTGYVFATQCQGGIVGEVKYTCTIATCFNYAGGDLIPVNGSYPPHRGAIAGDYDANATTFTNNYYSYYMGLPPTGKQGAATADSSGQYMYLGAWGRGAFNAQSSFSGFDFTNVYMMQSDRPKLRMEGGVATYTDTGPTTIADTTPTEIRIYTVQELENFRDNVNRTTDYSKTTIKLCADLDMSGVNWTPIGTENEAAYFNGTFDGQGHTIYNLSVSSGSIIVGLFGTVSGTVKNLEVHGAVTSTNTSGGYAGGIVGGVVGGTVANCAFYGDVKGGSTDTCYAGGVVGLLNYGTVRNCFHVGTVSGAAVSAGVVSYLAHGTVENCFHYSGQITGTYPAGVVGFNNGTANNCFALTGTATNLIALGSGTNCAFKSADEFKNSTLGLGGAWLCGGEHPELVSLSWIAALAPNGGTGNAANYGVPFFHGTLPPCPFYRDGGYTFLGWNTEADGTGTWYDDCGSLDHDEGLYAQWLQGWPYHGYTSADSALFDYAFSSVYTCAGIERGNAVTVSFTTNDAVRPCAIAFLIGNTPCATPPSWRLEAKVHASDGDWTVLAESDGASLSKTDKVVYARLSNVGDDFYSVYRIVWQGPSDALSLAEAYLLTADPDADVRRPLILHSNDGTDQTSVIDANNGAAVTLSNTFTSDGNFFLGWNTKPDGTGKSYANYEQITVDGVTDLYAQWLTGTHYRNYTALKAYDQTTPLENGVPQNDAQYLGYNTQEYSCLVDDNINSKWCVSVRADAFWSLEFSTDEYVKPVGYVLVTAEDTAKYPGRNPKNWTLEGLSADGTWVMLDGILQDQSLPAANRAEICRALGNSQEYCTFRITFRGLGSGSTFQLSELYLITDGSAREPVVTFDSHGGSGTTASVSGKTQSAAQLSENGFTREGYDFVNWNTAQNGSGTGYDAGASYLVTGDATLYAQWTPKTYTVKFLDESGETLYETTATSGETPVYKGEAPVKEGDAEFSYVFSGWTPVIAAVNKDATYTVRFEKVSNTYEDPAWSWGDNHSSATATFACINDQSREEMVETSDITSKTTPPTCTQDGKIEYTATVTFLGETYQGTDTVPIAATGHAYSLTGWTWDGYGKATATFTCDNDATHIENVNATITSKTTAPTCEGAGKTVYTAKVTFEGKEYKDTKTETLNPIGHAYALTGWMWDGYGKATATFTCGNDETHVKTADAAITAETTAPTCEGAGKTVYTAKVTFEDKTYKDEKTVTIDPTGHAYKFTKWEWTGTDSATATFTCGNDATHVENVDATITSVRTEPTCTAAGKIVYTAKVTFEGKEYKDTKTEKLDPTGHSYSDPKWNWATDYKTAEAIFACTSGDDEQTVKATVVALTVEPTCTLPGKITYTATLTFEDKNYEDSREVTIQPLGHSYGAADWTWADDFSTAKATFTCAVDPTHVEEVEAKVTSERTEPTCEEAGKIVYTALLTFEGKEFKDVKTVTIDPIGHAYTLTGWTWEGYEKATATFTCGNDASHVETVEAKITSERTEPTADDDGKVVYTATVTFEEKTYKDTKTEILPALGRDYELTGWTWTGYTAAVANFTDKNGSGDITVDAKITNVRTEPTCEEAGKIVYTATVTLNEKTYTDEKTEILDPIGHAYTLTGWIWTGYEAATVIFTCGNDASHVETVEAKITSERIAPACEEDGKIVYTATVTFEDKTYTDTKTETLDLIGHAYSLTDWAWDGYEKATATFTCGNDETHVKTVEAKITSERTDPTCEGEGKIVYTATVIFEEKTYTDTKTETLDPTGHSYALTGWTWDGYEKATATFTCGNDASHVVTVEAEIASERLDPTADENGKIVYTATVAFEEKTYTDEKTEILPALGREYELTGWTWDGYTSAKASFTDKNGSGDITVDAKITSVRTEPTCEEVGKVVYTAEVTLNGKTYTDEKTEALDPIGHAYALTEWTWTGCTAATATFTCGNDASHIVTVDATITSERTEPTADENGKIVYTATVVFEEKTYTDEKTEILPALGREYELTGWTWDGDTATVTLTDKNGSGEITVSATVATERTEPTCEADGKIVYTATATVGEQTFTDTKTEPLPATGHDWGEPTYTWAADDETVTATVTCLHDQSHQITETVRTEFVLTQYSTYKTEGKGVYTATFTNELFTTQTKEITIPAVACDGGDTCPGKHFVDEPPVEHWAHIPIDWAVVNKITFGTSATTFRPDEPCTRAQFVTFLWRTMGQPETTLTENPFNDVAEDAYYYKAVLWAFENKITLGTSETAFSPDMNCNRAQIVTFLWRMEGSEAPAATETSFTDIQSGSWYYTAVLWAVEKEITTGTSETTFSPIDLCTRAQCLAFLYREFAK